MTDTRIEEAAAQGRSGRPAGRDPGRRGAGQEGRALDPTPGPGVERLLRYLCGGVRPLAGIPRLCEPDPADLFRPLVAAPGRPPDRRRRCPGGDRRHVDRRGGPAVGQHPLALRPGPLRGVCGGRRPGAPRRGRVLAGDGGGPGRPVRRRGLDRARRPGPGPGGLAPPGPEAERAGPLVDGDLRDVRAGDLPEPRAGRVVPGGRGRRGRARPPDLAGVQHRRDRRPGRGFAPGLGPALPGGRTAPAPPVRQPRPSGPALWADPAVPALGQRRRVVRLRPDDPPGGHGGADLRRPSGRRRPAPTPGPRGSSWRPASGPPSPTRRTSSASWLRSAPCSGPSASASARPPRRQPRPSGRPSRSWAPASPGRSRSTRPRSWGSAWPRSP